MFHVGEICGTESALSSRFQDIAKGNSVVLYPTPRLSVPASPQKECATLRVANVTHAWEDGKLLFFDDSFEHEVFNHCDQERVVFQLVFAHPDLGTGDEAIKCATGEAPCAEL